MRSFTEPSGLKNSSLSARSAAGPRPRRSRGSRTSGVVPISLEDAAEDPPAGWSPGCEALRPARVGGRPTEGEPPGHRVRSRRRIVHRAGRSGAAERSRPYVSPARGSGEPSAGRRRSARRPPARRICASGPDACTCLDKAGPAAAMQADFVRPDREPSPGHVRRGLRGVSRDHRSCAMPHATWQVKPDRSPRNS